MLRYLSGRTLTSEYNVFPEQLNAKTVFALTLLLIFFFIKPTCIVIHIFKNFLNALQVLMGLSDFADTCTMNA